MSVEQPETNLAGIDEGAVLVTGPKRIQLTTAQKVGVAALAAFVFLSFIWIQYMLSSDEVDRQPELALQQNRDTFRAPPLSLPPATPPGTPTVPEAQVVPELVPGSPATPAPPSAPSDNPIFSYGGNSGGAPAAIPSQGQVVPSLDSGGTIRSERPPSPAFDSNKATLLPNPDMLITKGTIIPCTLQTAINTELAGYAKCVVPTAVRGTTGNVVLLERGTTIVGEVQKATSAGQERVFVLWDRVETPSHVVVTLNSPGADELGRPGVTGKINRHFQERFGNAMLLSVLQGSLQAGTAFAGNSGTGVGTFFNNFQSNGDQLTSEALQSGMNIPSTIEKIQGGNVSIFVAKDLDFSGVYRLRRIK